MKGKVRVAILGYYPPEETTKNLGGAHIHVFDLTEQLRKYEDLDVHVITNSNKIKKDRTIKKDNLTIHYLSSPKLPRLITSLSIDQYKLIKKIKEVNPDIVHAQGTAPMTGFTTTLLRTKYPVLLTVHGIVQEEAKTWQGPIGLLKGIIYGLMEKYTLHRIKNIIVVSPYVKEKIKPLCKDSKIQVIPVGINEDFFNVPDNEKENRLLFVGGIEPRKGLLHLLNAVKLIRGTIHNIDLHIVGRIRKKRYFNTLSKYIRDNNLDDNVKFLGFLTNEEVKREYSECSIFVLPSKEESLGLVLVEVMATEKPIVASKIGGIPYVVDNNETGFLVNYGNSEQLAEKIILLLKDEDLRRKMGVKGKKKAKEFRNEEIAKRIYEIYGVVISNEKGK